MEQLVARRAHNPKVAGSSPVPATTKPEYDKYSGFFILIPIRFTVTNRVTNPKFQRKATAFYQQSRSEFIEQCLFNNSARPTL